MGLLDDVEGDEHRDAAEEGKTPSGAPGKPPTAKDAKKEHHDNMIIILVGILGVVVTYLIYRKSQASSTTSATNPLPSTGTVAGAGGADDGAIESMIDSLGAQETANGQALSGFQTLLGNMQTEIAGLSSGPGPTSNPSTQTSASAGLPYVGPQSMPNIIQPGQYTAGQFEVVGQETNGQYSGEQVAGGVPLFGTAFGGLFQNFGLQGGPAPNYSGPVYAPTADAQYVGYTGAVSGAPSK